jgi:hypothetical protein
MGKLDGPVFSEIISIGGTNWQTIYVSKRPAEPLVYLGHPVVSLFIRVNQLSAYLSGSNNCQLIYLGQPIVSLFIWV